MKESSLTERKATKGEVERMGMVTSWIETSNKDIGNRRDTSKNFEDMSNSWASTTSFEGGKQCEGKKIFMLQVSGLQYYPAGKPLNGLQTVGWGLVERVRCCAAVLQNWKKPGLCAGCDEDVRTLNEIHVNQANYPTIFFSPQITSIWMFQGKGKYLSA